MRSFANPVALCAVLIPLLATNAAGQSSLTPESRSVVAKSSPALSASDYLEHFEVVTPPALLLETCHKFRCWTSLCKVRAAAIAMQRWNTSSAPLVIDDNGNDVINTSQFDFSYAPGFDVGLLCPISKYCDLSARYFRLGESKANASGDVLTATGTIPTTPPTLIDGGAVAFDYETTLQSAEINVGRNLANNCCIFGGFRFIELNERLRGSFDAGVPFSYDVDANNRLYGFQAGAETTLWGAGTRFRLDGFGKVGIFANETNQLTTVEQPVGTPFSSARANDLVASLMGEAGVVATYRLGRNWSVNLGYQILWLDGIALAADQASSTGDLAVGGPTSATVDRSHVIYHGGFVGLDFAF